MKAFRSASAGALWLAWAWGIYAVLEAILGWLEPGLAAWLRPDSDFARDPWVGVAFLLVWPLLGALAGALLGAALGAAGRPPSRESWRGLASFSVVLGLWGALAGSDSVGVSGAVMGALLAGVIVVGSWRVRRSVGWRVLADPLWGVPLATLWVWLLRGPLSEASLPVRLAATLALLVVAGIVARRLQRRPLQKVPSWHVAWAGVALGLASVFLATGLGRLAEPPLPDARAPASAARPSVLLVVLDTVRADHLSLYGYERKTTPHLDHFAERAWVFEDVTMPADMTLSGHASLFTGRYVYHHGAQEVSGRLDASAVTLAELLSHAGYTTAAVVANCGWLDSRHGLAQGFAFYDARCGVSPFAGSRGALLKSSVLDELRRVLFPEQATWRWRSAEDITDEALRLWEQLAHGPRPLFLFVNYMDVHRPIQPPGSYATLFPGRDPSFRMMEDWSRAERQGVASAAQRRHLVSQYDGALRYLDAQLQRLLVRSGGALVVVTADHGEGFGDGHGFGHGRSVYQDVVGVPLVIRQPEQQEGRRLRMPVSGVDVLPSVLAALDLPLPTQLEVDGRSLATGAADGARTLISESYSPKGRTAMALRRGSLKVISRAGAAPELYDLREDPGELHDLAAAGAALPLDLRTALAKLRYSREPTERPGLDPRERKRLQALGYLQ